MVFTSSYWMGHKPGQRGARARQASILTTLNTWGPSTVSVGSKHGKLDFKRSKHMGSKHGQRGVRARQAEPAGVKICLEPAICESNSQAGAASSRRAFWFCEPQQVGIWNPRCQGIVLEHKKRRCYKLSLPNSQDYESIHKIQCTHLSDDQTIVVVLL